MARATDPGRALRRRKRRCATKEISCQPISYSRACASETRQNSISLGHNVKRLAGGTKFEVVEGPDVEGVFILEFPTYEEAKAWYDSPLYRAASKHRYLGGDFTAVIVDGVPSA